MLRRRTTCLALSSFEELTLFKSVKGGKIKVDQEPIPFGQSTSSSLVLTICETEKSLISSKPSTDMAYNNSITTILSTLSHQLNSTEPHKALSVVFGTHNPDSCDLVTSNLVKYGLASKVDEESKLLKLRDDVVGKVFVAQLYGMFFFSP
jgi:hypothetical protein